MANKLRLAVAYLRTSSAASVGADKDSDKRQRAAIEAFAKRAGFTIVEEYYDAAVSGADPVDQRPGFCEMLQRLATNGAKTIIVESPDRFARDLAVQLAGHDMLRVSASRSSLHRRPTSSPRTRPPLFWCAKCWGPSLNLRRLDGWQQLGNASVSVRDGAGEESLSVKRDLRLSLWRVSCAGVGPRAVGFP